MEITITDSYRTRILVCFLKQHDQNFVTSFQSIVIAFIADISKTRLSLTHPPTHSLTHTHIHTHTLTHTHTHTNTHTQTHTHTNTHTLSHISKYTIIYFTLQCSRGSSGRSYEKVTETCTGQLNPPPRINLQP